MSEKTIPFYLPATLGILWLCSGLLPLLWAQAESLQLLAQMGIAPEWHYPLLLSAAVLDVCFGIACFSRLRRCKWFWLAQCLTVAVYSVLISFRLPEFWLHPFAPVLKNLPIMALMWFLYCVNKE